MFIHVSKIQFVSLLLIYFSSFSGALFPPYKNLKLELNIMGASIAKFSFPIKHFGTTVREIQKLVLKEIPEHLQEEIGNNSSRVMLCVNETQLHPRETLKEVNLQQGGSIQVSLDNLRKLNLSCQRLSALDVSVIKHFQNLQDLNLTQNNLTELPDGISSLRKLRVLTLQNNKLRTLPTHLENLCSLTTLDIQNNPINNLPVTLASLKHLKEICIGGTALIELPSDFLSFVQRGGRFDIGTRWIP
jgi:antitoxin component of MazEF toxin-antitoxin module